MLLCLLEDSGYVNQNHDVTKTDTENILPEQNDMSGRELETNRFDVDLDELFSCVIENEGLSHAPRSWREAETNFGKIVALCSKTSHSFIMNSCNW